MRDNLTTPTSVRDLAERLEAAAQRTLVMYCGVDEKWCRSMANTYQKETGVQIDMTRMSAGEIFARIRAEKDNPHGDIWWGGTGDPHLQAADEGLTEPYQSPVLPKLRDWAQRQGACHDYFCHRRSFWHDAWWQMHCELVLDHAPAFVPEQHLADSRFYAFIERYWMAQQLPWAILFFALGGWSWVVWGICARVAVSVPGHWLVGHFAHREGGQSWVVEGAAAQGYNITIAGLISMGESWHNNHHAFPGSARLGLFPGEVDLGWWLILAFERLGLAQAIVTPDIMPQRTELRALARQGSGCCIAKRLLPV